MISASSTASVTTFLRGKGIADAAYLSFLNHFSVWCVTKSPYESMTFQVVSIGIFVAQMSSKGRIDGAVINIMVSCSTKQDSRKSARSECVNDS